MDDIEILKQLKQHGDDKATAKFAVASHMAHIARLVPKAVDAGISKAEIARRAQISVPTVYEMLREKGHPAGGVEIK